MHLWLASPLLSAPSLGRWQKKFLLNGKRKELSAGVKELFHTRKELPTEGKEPFSMWKELPAPRKEPFHAEKELSAKGKEPISVRKELLTQRKEPFHAGKQGFAAEGEGFSTQALLSPAAARLPAATACLRDTALLPIFPQAARTAAGLLPSRRFAAGCRRSQTLPPAT